MSLDLTEGPAPMSFPGPLPIVPGDDATFWENQGTSSSSALTDSSPRNGKASWRKGDHVCGARPGPGARQAGACLLQSRG